MKGDVYRDDGKLILYFILLPLSRLVEMITIIISSYILILTIYAHTIIFVLVISVVNIPFLYISITPYCSFMYLFLFLFTIRIVIIIAFRPSVQFSFSCYYIILVRLGLTLYKTFGKAIEFKKYLHGVADAGSRLLFKFRSGTHEELGRHRGREGNKGCVLCGNECESVSHVLWECSA